MDNEKLKKIYEEIYQNGEENFFSFYINGENISDTDKVILSITDWKNKNVVDLGCGAGKTAYFVACAGAKSVVGIDYSETAIAKAKSQYKAENLYYQCMNLSDWKEPVDIVMSNGTLEHINNPKEALLNMASLVGENGEVIISCPCFLNIRGIIWMTLQKLLDVPMSLTDISFISPFDIEEWLRDQSFYIDRRYSFDNSQGNGELMLLDFQKRLTNALKDANLDNSKVANFLEWVDKMLQYLGEDKLKNFDGAMMVYVIKKGDCPASSRT
jgi:2-polyprenyl-3-methyl-5-hydroxy-6-metoxy-1,4-benzoquinol methylase